MISETSGVYSNEAGDFNTTELFLDLPCMLCDRIGSHRQFTPFFNLRESLGGHQLCSNTSQSFRGPEESHQVCYSLDI